MTDFQSSELPWTGERLVTSIFNYGAIDHLHRYAIASELVFNKQVLDIASGEGYGTYLIAKNAKFVTGVDISQQAIEHARKKYQASNIEFKIGSTDSIPLIDGAVDVVISFETIEHHDRHTEMMLEIKRVLKSDGILIISSPDRLNYSEIPGIKNPFHIKELYQNEFKTLIRTHFKNTVFLNQKSVNGSLIIPENSCPGFSEFMGNYGALSAFNIMQQPIYNICLASNNELPQMPCSFYSGMESQEHKEIKVESEEEKTYNESVGKKWIKLFLPPVCFKVYHKLRKRK
jgi:SAM-dependent methyltransferase